VGIAGLTLGSRLQSSPEELHKCRLALKLLLTHIHAMTVLTEILSFLRARAPLAACDACISKALSLTRLRTREIATEPDFDRGKGRCTLCGETTRIVTRAREV